MYNNNITKIYNTFISDLTKQIIGKINKVLYKLDNIENRFDILEEKIQPSRHYNDSEYDIQFPISTFTELINFEEQIKEATFKDKVV